MRCDWARRADPSRVSQGSEIKDVRYSGNGLPLFVRSILTLAVQVGFVSSKSRRAGLLLDATLQQSRLETRYAALSDIISFYSQIDGYPAFLEILGLRLLLLRNQ